MSRRPSRRSRSNDAEEAAVIRRPAVSWFPGHMHKAQKRLAQEVRNADAVLEVRDARLPLLSGNPELLRIVGDRPRLLLLNKASLADPGRTRDWVAYFAAHGIRALPLDADSRSGINLIFPPLREATTDWAARYRRRNMRPPPLRLMVVGMPNVGKSTLINRLMRSSRLKTAPVPGVTRAVSWVPLGQEHLLMDSPGVMLPRIADEAEAHRLGWIGALPDEAIGALPLVTSLLGFLLPIAAKQLHAHYDLPGSPPEQPEQWLAALCARRGFLQAGGAPEAHRGAEVVLADFRAGHLGRYSLEVAPSGARPTD